MTQAQRIMCGVRSASRRYYGSRRLGLPRQLARAGRLARQATVSVADMERALQQMLSAQGQP